MQRFEERERLKEEKNSEEASGKIAKGRAQNDRERRRERAKGGNQLEKFWKIPAWV